MKELLQTIFKTTEDRLKNPFIGAFTTSWLVFNWNAILYLLFSKKDIEEKIRYIENNLSHEATAIWFPLLSALSYTLLLPYLNLLIDEALNYSVVRSERNIIRKKTSNIENQKLLAIEEIKLEESKTEFRERKQKNNLIEELQKKVAQYENEIESSRNSAAQSIDSLKNSLRQQDENYAKELAKYEEAINSIQREKGEYLDSIQQLKSEVELTKSIIKDNGSNLSSLQSEINARDHRISVLTKQLADYETENKPRRLIYKFNNGAELYERSDNNRTFYIDRNNSRVYDENDFENLKNGYSLNKFYE